VGAARLLVDGSFVTAKEEPHDVDTVILLPQTFSQLVEQEYPPAVELEEMLFPPPGRDFRGGVLPKAGRGDCMRNPLCYRRNTTVRSRLL
jgi:hypothetical protein